MRHLEFSLGDLLVCLILLQDVFELALDALGDFTVLFDSLVGHLQPLLEQPDFGLAFRELVFELAELARLDAAFWDYHHGVFQFLAQFFDVRRLLHPIFTNLS